MTSVSGATCRSPVHHTDPKKIIKKENNKEKERSQKVDENLSPPSLKVPRVGPLLPTSPSKKWKKRNNSDDNTIQCIKYLSSFSNVITLLLSLL